ncbi:MAG: glycosyltransferase family 39 protein [Candidatus Promineifilaceae bacterium]|nr:glycosyltransferase family 39 protein [Candidatus Promineifilaceae bacterium]
MLKKLLPIIIIFIIALALRSYRLTEVPPGLTHDEANHGREAIEILDGQLRYYFPLNYGSEPLYSYAVAGSMILFGEGLLALRLVNVFTGLAAILVMIVWTSRAFDRTTALITAALIALSFWPLASSRESLRAGMLPLFTILAVWFFWKIIYFDEDSGAAPEGSVAHIERRLIWLVIGFAISILIMLHIYLAARVAWLMFPIFLIYLALFHRRCFSRAWKPVILGLILAGLLSIPMFVYLANNPESQTRLSMLGSTFQQISNGNWRPLIQNMTGALLAFIWPGFGDQFLAYNIPGRPVFDLLSAVFFIIGILISLRRWKQPMYAFILCWFMVGIIPSLVTGATANTTRNLAALPVVYLFPALGIVSILGFIAQRLKLSQRTVLTFGALILLSIIGLFTIRDYFYRWAEAPEVRTAYQNTLLEELAYLDENGITNSAVVLSTVYPGPAHDPSIALIMAGPQSEQFRWIDARSALIIPPENDSRALIPTSTPHHTAFDTYLRPLDTQLMRHNDLDPGFTLYAIDASASSARAADDIQANFGGAVLLEQAYWLSPQVMPGETAELVTQWRILDPVKVGPIHAPAYATEAIFFSHVLDSNDGILAQQDLLGAPSWGWQAGDTILQVHAIDIPADAQPGPYPTVVGIYDRPTGQRLPLLDDRSGATTAQVPHLQVAQSENSTQN